MERLLKSKEFYVALFGALFAIAGYFTGKYAPQYVEDIKFLISVVEPLIAIILSAMFVANKVEALNADILALRVELGTEE